MARIGILGGTFDPIHNGHLALGRQAYEEYNLAQVWFMPAGIPPHKSDRIVTESLKRCEMVKLAVKSDSRFAFTDFEISRKGTNYTADTLQELSKLYPEHEFFFIIGADSLYQIETWYHPELILSAVTILVAGREYEQTVRSIDEQILYLCQKYQARICLLHCPEMNVSSEQIRQMVAAGADLGGYVPAQVEEYIRKHRLYEVIRA